MDSAVKKILPTPWVRWTVAFMAVVLFGFALLDVGAMAGRHQEARRMAASAIHLEVVPMPMPMPMPPRHITVIMRRNQGIRA